jgi:predicted nucleotidyltransferase
MRAANWRVRMNIESLIEDVVSEIKFVSGIKAIVLGGSRARGTNHSASDIDLGLYYDSHSPLNVNELSKVAEKLDDEHQANLITAIGGWGPWINGGGWLHIQSMPVDFLYRDLDKVEDVINSCLKGTVEIFYQPGHPHGFISSIYLGEIAICKPLWDPEDVVTRLKERVLPYPAALQEALIQKFRWEVDFSIGIAQKSVAKRDIAYAAGCCFRSVMCMLQVLFALNKEHWLNEKGAVAIANNFQIKPANFQERINKIFTSLAASSESIDKSITLLKELSTDINTLLQDNG